MGLLDLLKLGRGKPASATAGQRATAYEPSRFPSSSSTDSPSSRPVISTKETSKTNSSESALEKAAAAAGVSSQSMNGAGDGAVNGGSNGQGNGNGSTEQVGDESTIRRSQSIRFAPLSIPSHRRLQTAAVLLWELLLFLCLAVFFILMSIPLLWPIMIPYIVWMLFIDTAPETGGRKFTWVRRLPVWRYFAEYYPISLIKSVELPPDRPYVFGYHPHGIIGVGAVSNFGTEATEFADSFPGLNPHLLTLATNFQIPIFRDILMGMGMYSVSRRSCERILKKGKGSCITIVVGGATESLKAKPGTADLTLRRRLGFIKIAIRQGASLVPVFSFGENDIFQQLSNEKGTAVHSFQKNFQSLFGFTLPLFHGRGIFNYHLGFVPYRHPIVSVVGRPIHTVKTANPSQEMLNAVQEEYITELLRIWDTWKDAYAANRTRELTIVE